MKSLFLACLICITHLKAADIVVYGGVPCGIAASIVAAREGAKVVLIEPTKHVGGLSTSGINTAESEHINNHSHIYSLGHFGGQFDWPDASCEQRAGIYQDHMDYTLGQLHFHATDAAVPVKVQEEMKSLGLHKNEFADNGNLPYQLYLREARRMRGKFVVRQQDVQEDRRKPDSIGMSSHFLDCHHVQRVALNDAEFVNGGRIWRIGFAYQIPYRAFTPNGLECTNLLVPGAASYTHVAFCTLRVQKQVVDFTPGLPEKCEHLNGPPEF